MIKARDIFIKLHSDAIDSGLIADLGAERWQTLCVLASYMDSNGRCYPTLSLIARNLGVSVPTASKRVRNLAAYRWKGKPIVTVEQSREEGKFSRNVYRISPESGLFIF